MDPNVILNRVMRLARLDTTVFDEVRDDTNETISAVIVAVVSALLAGFGSSLWWAIVPNSSYRDSVSGKWVNTLILGTIFMALMLAVAVVIAYVVIVQIYKVQADLQSMLRTMGYGSIPVALSVLMFIPLIWPVFGLLPIALLLVMWIYAIQASTGADSTQVVVAATAALGALVLVLGFIASLASIGDVPMGAGIFGALFSLKS
jgi:hypothetical protein